MILKGSKLTPDEKFDKIINMLGDIQFALKDIMGELSKQPQPNINPSIEIELLPIKSFADLQIFEERLNQKETEFKLHLVNMFVFLKN